MNIPQIVLSVLAMLLVTIASMALIGTFSRRVLGVRIGTIRITLAGLIGLAAEVGFESQFIWRQGEYTPALIPVQLGIILLGAVGFLVVAELAVPQGSMPRPDQWIPGIRRSAGRARRYSQLVGIAFRHRLVPFKPNTDHTSAASAERALAARALKAALEEAGGAFVKLGQVLSTREDILPTEFIEELAKLQQQVPPMPWGQAAAVLSAELGHPIEEVFREIAHDPIAAASIGQVHLATLADGERVAVKIQREGIIPLVERDVDITRRVATKLAESTVWARQFGVQELADSLAESLIDELDYRVEASNIAALEAAVASHGSGERLRIPKLHPRLSSRRVLVMEFLVGRTLSEPSAVEGLDQARRQELATLLLRSVLNQIMDDGVFHSDLHPGNVLITPDAELALLDFGSVGRLDSEVRRQITDLLLAFSRTDSRAFADALLAFVDLPDDVDERALRLEIGAFLARHLGSGASLDVTALMQVIAVLANHRLALPAQLTATARALGTVEGTLRVLSPAFDFVAEASGYAGKRLTDARRPEVLARTVEDELVGLVPLVRQLPQRLDRITGSLADGRLSVNVRLLADRRDRDILRQFINLAAITFLAGVFGIMAVMLLTSLAGPMLTSTLSLFEVFGYMLVLVSSVLTLRVLFEVFGGKLRA